MHHDVFNASEPSSPCLSYQGTFSHFNTRVFDSAKNLTVFDVCDFLDHDLIVNTYTACVKSNTFADSGLNDSPWFKYHRL